MSEDKQLELFDDILDKDISSIDRLFLDVKQYRKCSDFKKKLDFYSSFPYLSAYNAALVEQQRPGARFVLTAKKWRELHNRKIKANARPVIILMPFYPVDFLFDITDTKPIDKNSKENDNIVIEQIINQFTASCQHEVRFYLDNIDKNLPKQGISYNNQLITGSELQAEIRQDQSEELYFKINNEHVVKHHNYFTISINMRATPTEMLVAIFHELGHLFCQHIECTWWKGRYYTKAIKEFEAETVSYLVCKRLGIHTHSVEYLANYLETNDNIPPISIECVFQAVDMIEQMAKGNIDITKCLLYKKDSSFKEKVNKEKVKIKMEKEARASY